MSAATLSAVRAAPSAAPIRTLRAPPRVAAPHRAGRAFCLTIGRLAVRCLHAELVLYPKPGLVSLHDNGSHHDMTAATFLRSIFALRHYFIGICRAGLEDASFARLSALGMEAERRMLRATGGINTHRGAIFSLGLLCAAIGRHQAEGAGAATSAGALRATLLRRWGRDLARHARSGGSASHGARVATLFAAGGAREQAARGLPAVFEVALPALRRTLDAGRDLRHARIDALFALMAHLSDSNVLHRGGRAGALTVQRQARRFLAQGGSAHPRWLDAALACHRRFMAQRLSPGGAADLLAATCLVHAVAGMTGP
ncbi:MAG: triphosphoribosyl-dephospho-CoA synthase MdcB [Pseudomonadota bacterium]